MFQQTNGNGHYPSNHQQQQQQHQQQQHSTGIDVSRHEEIFPWIITSVSRFLSFQYRHAFLKQQEEMQSLRELMLLKDNRIRLLEDELRHLKSHENDLPR